MNEGRGDAVPIFLHDIPYLFERKIIPVDVAVISVRKSCQILVLRPLNSLLCFASFDDVSILNLTT